MSQSLKSCMKSDNLPTCQHYRELLEIAHKKTGLNYSNLREIGGYWPYKQWAFFLSI